MDSDYKIVRIRSPGLCIPATLGGELEHYSMRKPIIYLSIGVAVYIYGTG